MVGNAKWWKTRSYELVCGVTIHMDKELEKYRANRAEKYRQTKQSVWNPSFYLQWTRNSNFTTWFGSDTYTDRNEKVLFWFILFLKFLFWILLWGFFIQIEFGTVFFIVSMFYWVYTSMQAGTRKAWEPSAYSVFNENCEAIDGTLNAEQFERELKFGAGAVSSK